MAGRALQAFFSSPAYTSYAPTELVRTSDWVATRQSNQGKRCSRDGIRAPPTTARTGVIFVVSHGPGRLPPGVPRRRTRRISSCKSELLSDSERGLAHHISGLHCPKCIRRVHLPMARARRVSTAVSNGRVVRSTWARSVPPSSVASRVVARSSGSMSDGSFPSA